MVGAASVSFHVLLFAKRAMMVAFAPEQTTAGPHLNSPFSPPTCKGARSGPFACPRILAPLACFYFATLAGFCSAVDTLPTAILVCDSGSPASSFTRTVAS